MKYAAFITVLMLSAATAAQSQSMFSEDLDFCTERVFMSPEKTQYQAGDTIRLNGQVISTLLDDYSPYSNYLYLEIIDKNDSALLREKVSCKDKGYFNAELNTNAAWLPAIYRIRAHTLFMRNFNSQSFSSIPIAIGNIPQKDAFSKDVKCAFFPEGGNLLAGFVQSVAFYLSDDNDSPVSTNAILRNSKGDSVTSALTLPSGLGMLHFIPAPKEIYRLETSLNGKKYSFNLQALDKGVTLQANLLNERRFCCRILSKDVNTEKYHLYLFHQDTGLTELPIDSARRESEANMKESSPGLAALFLTDENGKTVAQRMIWKNIHEASHPVKFSVEKDQYSPNETVQYKLNDLPSDSRVFVRIIPKKAISLPHAYQEMMFGDLDSKVPFPNNFYTENSLMQKNDLQAWFCTATFKRFDIRQALMHKPLYWLPERNLVISGKVSRLGQPLNGGLVIADYKSQSYNVPLDEKGHFSMAVNDFQNGENFLFHAFSTVGESKIYSFDFDNDAFNLNAEEKIVPGGTSYSPIGLYNSYCKYAEPEKIAAPSQQGDYKLLIDVITPKTHIYSFEKTLVVK